MKKLQTDGKSYVVEETFPVACGETRVARSEVVTRIHRSRRNLERLIRHKRMSGTASTLSLCICVHKHL